MKWIIIIFAGLFMVSWNTVVHGKAGSRLNSVEKQGTVVCPFADPQTKITVTITGSPNAGSYNASSKEPTCSMGYTGEKSFGNQYSETGKTDKQLSSLQLIVNDYDSAKTGTTEFMVTVGFGELYVGKSYTISGLENSKKQGSGKLTITESGSSKTVVLEGKTEDGVGISATIICGTVVH